MAIFVGFFDGHFTILIKSNGQIMNNWELIAKFVPSFIYEPNKKLKL